MVFSHTPFILVTLTSRAALLGLSVRCCPAGDVGGGRGENNIRHTRNNDAHTVDRNGPEIPGTGRHLFVNDDESTRQGNRLINTRDRDLVTVDAEVAYLDTTLANRSFRCTRALGTRRHNDTGNGVATHVQNMACDRLWSPAP